jgi:hypothetical protein
MSIHERRSAQSFVLAGTLVIAAMLAIGGIFAYQNWSKGQTLGPDYCRQDGPSGILAIAVDATDVLSEAQRLDVMNRLETAISQAGTNWRVEIWNVAPSSGVPTISGTARCIPPRDVSSLTANPAKAKARYSEFADAMRKELADILGQTVSPSSPILESIQAVGLRSFRSPELGTAHPLRLLLVSDLVQNTSRVSFIGGIPRYDEFRQSKTFEAVRAPLGGASVEILFLSRQAGLSSSELVGWWQTYFSDVGASLTSVQRIVG